jgi:hypothetical protein
LADRTRQDECWKIEGSLQENGERRETRLTGKLKAKKVTAPQAKAFSVHLLTASDRSSAVFVYCRGKRWPLHRNVVVVGSGSVC